MGEEKRLNEVIRVQKLPRNFVMLDKGFLENPNLSWKAKGILAYLLSKPDNWKVIIGDIVKYSTDGKSSIYSGLAELKEHGYYVKTAVRSEDGRRIDHWESTVYELPQAVNPKNAGNTPSSLLTDFQEIENQYIENQYIENRERNNNYINNNYINNNHVSQVLSDERDKTDGTDDMRDALNAVEAYTEQVKANISYSDLALARPYDMRLVDDFIAIIVDTVLSVGDTVRIDGEDKPRALVASTLQKLNDSDIELVLDQFKGITSRISKKKQYILTMLYNSKLEGNTHYTNLVNYDLSQPSQE
jgi:hypothetical protein